MQAPTTLPIVTIGLTEGKRFLDLYFHEGHYGGMLVPGVTDVQLGEAINVEIVFEKENRLLNIIGVCKWRRLKTRGSLQKGVGVEFDESQRHARDNLLQFAEGRLVYINSRGVDRLPGHVEVVYQSDDVFLTDMTDNLSPSGAFLRTDNPKLRIGDKFDITLKLPSSTHGIKVAAEIIWIQNQEQPHGVGVRFLHPWFRPGWSLNRLVDKIRIHMKKNRRGDRNK